MTDGERIKTDDKLSKFLGRVQAMRWRSGNVPKIWNSQYRFALSNDLIKIGWGGVLELTEDGAGLAQS